MKNDYAVFIISHKRPEVETLKTLERSGYQGEYFIVVDDKDPTIAEYKSKYGEHLLVFSKEEILKDTDTIDNFNQFNSATYARNFSIKAAREKNYKYLINLDDDIKKFSIRFEKNGKFSSKDISEINIVFEKYIEFLKTSKFNCLGFILSTKLIGGLENSIAKNKFYFAPYNAFILRTSSNFFRGTIFEDTIYAVMENSIGHCTYALMPVVICTREVFNSVGGLQEAYLNRNEYAEFFRVKIINPSSISIRLDCTGNVSAQMHQNFFLPKILNEEWKKK